MKHVLYTDADRDRPDVICDRNGQVVLDLCKACGLGEAELLDSPQCSGPHRTTAAAPHLERVAAYEWSTDYRCVACNFTFNVSDDSDYVLDPQRAHRCVLARETPAQEAFCDRNCCWSGHHEDCVRAAGEQRC